MYFDFTKGGQDSKLSDVNKIGTKLLHSSKLQEWKFTAANTGKKISKLTDLSKKVSTAKTTTTANTLTSKKWLIGNDINV